MRDIQASRFKAQCLSIMRTVQRTGQPVLITLHGKPCAELVPYARKHEVQLGALIGHVEVRGDIVHTDWSTDWDP